MPTFDGENLVVTLDGGSSVINMSWGDIYSDWKDWMRASPNNRKYPPAFRSAGGDPINTFLNSGAYFFLRNDYGWRIKPAEQDVTYYASGNLAPEDANLNSFLPTTGAYTTQIIGLQPVTQGFSAQLAAGLELSFFNHGVTIDVVNGLSGTGNDVNGNPIGTPNVPVNNLDDAVLIQTTRNLSRVIYVLGDLHITSSVPALDEFTFYGEGMDRSTIDIEPDAVVTDCEYHDATVTGTLDGNSRLVNCLIDDLIYVKGFIEQCVLAPGTIQLDGSEEAHFLDCWSGVPGTGTPEIDMGGSGQALALRNYNGGIKISNKSGNDPVSIDLNSGQIILDATVTGGDIVCRGIGKISDNSSGANVLADDLLNHENISKVNWDIVFIDTVNGYGGTDFPTGTASRPSNNITDAKTICEANHIKNIIFSGTLLIGTDMVEYNISGKTSVTQNIAVVQGVDITNTLFQFCTVTGSAAATSSDMQFRDALASDFYGFDGIIIRGGIGGTFQVKSGGTMLGKNFAFAGPDNIVDANGAAFLAMNYTGLCTVQNLTGGGFLQVASYAGSLTLDSTCDGGVGKLFGTVKFVDNSTSFTLLDSDLINQESIASTVWDYERP